MDSDRRAKSILEFLTAKNCSINAKEPRSKTNSKNPSWHTPKQINVWHEFNFETLESIYNGRLMEELRDERRRLPEYPSTSPESRTDCNEDDTVSILLKWSHTIVEQSLCAVRDTMHPSIWVGGGRRPSNWSSTVSIRSGKSQWKPDAGAIAACGKDERERLPKEYKVAKKWRSRLLYQKNLIDSDGKWCRGYTRSKEAMPIRQAFTYCVTKGCRYGCILSTEEAFIFRIKPRSQPIG